MLRLGKSSFLKGRQCPRRLWLALRRPPEPELESEEVWEQREAEGAEVERLAEALFPNARRIAEASEEGEEDELTGDGSLRELAESTRRALDEHRPIFQAHLATDALLAIADVLEPRGEAWYLWEVKASTETKPLFDWDLAFQVEVARRMGIAIAGAGVLRLDREYVREGELDAARLLVREDRSAPVAGLAGEVRSEIEAQLRILAADEVPEATPGARCKANSKARDGRRPSDCGQLVPDGSCGARLPAHWAGRLPRLSETKWDAIAGMSDPSIERLDPDEPSWTEPQRRTILAVQRGRAVIDPRALRERLDRLVWPVAYIDFEFDPGMAVPRFERSRPYERIPFQWSMHVQQAPGAGLVRPEPFLHVGLDDPRRAFFESFRAALPPAGSVVAHSAPAELTVLDQLARSLGGACVELAADVRARVFDTAELVRRGYAHPAQQGSHSIKKVAPVLLARGYEDLALQDGMAAVATWKRACDPTVDADERERLRAELLAYCGRDTELLHELVEALRALAN